MSDSSFYVGVALSTLDVPIEVAEKLAKRYPYVWTSLVTNARCRAGGEAVRQLSSGDTPVQTFEALMCGVAFDVPGVRDRIVTVALPEWMVLWLLSWGYLNDEQQVALVSSEHTMHMLWYLMNYVSMCTAAREAATARWSGEYVSSHDWQSSSQAARDMELRRAHYERVITGGIEFATTRGYKGDLSYSAEMARDLLGEGNSEESRASWERLFDLVEGRVSYDLDAVIEVAGKRLVWC